MMPLAASSTSEKVIRSSNALRTLALSGLCGHFESDVCKPLSLSVVAMSVPFLCCPAPVSPRRRPLDRSRPRTRLGVPVITELVGLDLDLLLGQPDPQGRILILDRWHPIIRQPTTTNRFPPFHLLRRSLFLSSFLLSFFLKRSSNF